MTALVLVVSLLTAQGEVVSGFSNVYRSAGGSGAGNGNLNTDADCIDWPTRGRLCAAADGQYYFQEEIGAPGEKFDIDLGYGPNQMSFSSTSGLTTLNLNGLALVSTADIVANGGVVSTNGDVAAYKIAGGEAMLTAANFRNPGIAENIGSVSFGAFNGAGTQLPSGAVVNSWDDVTAGAEDSSMAISIVDDGVYGGRLIVSGLDGSEGIYHLLPTQLNDTLTVANLATFNGGLTAVDPVTLPAVQHGELYRRDNTNSTFIGTIDTWREPAFWTAGEIKGMTWGSNNLMVAASGGAGVYSCSVSVSMFSAAGGSTPEVAIAVNGTVSDKCISKRYLASATIDSGASSVTCLLDLANSDVLDVRIRDRTATGNITLVHKNFNCHKL